MPTTASTASATITSTWPRLLIAGVTASLLVLSGCSMLDGLGGAEDADGHKPLGRERDIDERAAGGELQALEVGSEEGGGF